MPARAGRLFRRVARLGLGIAIGLVLGWVVAGYAQRYLPGTADHAAHAAAEYDRAQGDAPAHGE